MLESIGGLIVDTAQWLGLPLTLLLIAVLYTLLWVNWRQE
jgi:hypothetical protein